MEQTKSNVLIYDLCSMMYEEIVAKLPYFVKIK